MFFISTQLSVLLKQKHYNMNQKRVKTPRVISVPKNGNTGEAKTPRVINVPDNGNTGVVKTPRVIDVPDNVPGGDTL